MPNLVDKIRARLAYTRAQAVPASQPITRVDGHFPAPAEAKSDALEQGDALAIDSSAESLSSVDNPEMTRVVGTSTSNEAATIAPPSTPNPPPPPDLLGDPCPDCGSKEKWVWLDQRRLCRPCLIRGSSPLAEEMTGSGSTDTDHLYSDEGMQVKARRSGFTPERQQRWS